MAFKNLSVRRIEICLQLGTFQKRLGPINNHSIVERRRIRIFSLGSRLCANTLPSTSVFQPASEQGGLVPSPTGNRHSTAAGNMLFQMLGVFAEFERAMIQERVKAGIARARANGTKTGKAIGPPRIKAHKLKAAHAALDDGKSIRAAARAAAISVGAAATLRKRMNAAGKADQPLEAGRTG